ncbi:acetyl-CoA carboxylase biotin carboxyl carrier protein subunit [Croceivirga radicis]|uniref:acetyl-CoA carboxylase biotin carboxyl carrier protein subunit n=1 Tax=Croceivirga radicis TaxID=1929488 RepID=UPI000255BA3E|nr:acetyl-CoA carboxylase biotin carboxyl carrier protein subunit [Croceivirga radicis]
MENRYIVKVGEDHTFAFSQEDLDQLDLIKKDQRNFHLIHENQNYAVSFSKSNFQKKQYQVVVNGIKNNVHIQNPLATLIKEMGLSVGNAAQVSSLIAPMPGLILELSVAVGQTVKEGETLLILEAMKMENALAAPRDGVIAAINVAQGDAVDKKQVLLTFED